MDGSLNVISHHQSIQSHNPSATSPTNNPGAAEVSTAQTNAIVAIETKLGTGASTPTQRNCVNW